MMNEEKEALKALVEHEKRNLTFYVLYYDELFENIGSRELEKAIDFHLDRLIVLLRRLNCD